MTSVPNAVKHYHVVVVQNFVFVAVNVDRVIDVRRIVRQDQPVLFADAHLTKQLALGSLHYDSVMRILNDDVKLNIPYSIFHVEFLALLTTVDITPWPRGLM